MSSYAHLHATQLSRAGADNAGMSNGFAQAKTVQTPTSPQTPANLHEQPAVPAHPYPGWMSPGGGDSTALLPWIDDDLRPSARTGGVPTPADLAPGAGPADLSFASSGVLLQAVQADVTSMYQMFQEGADHAIAALKMPPAPPDESFALKVLAQLAEGLAGFALGRLGTTVTDAVRRTFSGAAADAIKTTFGAYTKEAMQSAHSTVLAPLGHVKRSPPGAPAEWESPSSPTLLDEYRAETKNALIRSHRDAIERLLLVQDYVSRTEPAKLEELARAMHGAVDPRHIADFENEVVIGWLNFSASVSLGEEAEGQATSMPGANQVRGYETAGVEAIQAWRGSHAGFMEIAIELPDVIDGTKGLRLADVTITHDGPGAAETLKRMNTSLMGVPVFRRVTLRAGKSKLGWTPAIVFTPEGACEVDGGNPMLAAIGSKHPTQNDGLMAPAYGRDAEPSVAELVRADEAQAGARLVEDWLRGRTTREVRE